MCKLHTNLVKIKNRGPFIAQQLHGFAIDSHPLYDDKKYNVFF